MDPNVSNQQPVRDVDPIYGGTPQAGMPYALQQAPSSTAAQGGAVAIPAAPMPQLQPAAAPVIPRQQMAVAPAAPSIAPQVPVQAAQPQQQPTPTVSQMQPQSGVQPQGPGVHPASNPNSTQNTLQIAEIRDGIVIMSDGSFRSVVMVKSINFDLMSQQEQEAVEYSYQNFLNSLFFPIQIFIRSQKVDITPYLEKLDKIRSEHDNMLLALMMDDLPQLHFGAGPTD